MPNYTTLTVYLGSGEAGHKEEQKIIAESATLGMGKSEFGKFCIDEYFKAKERWQSRPVPKD